jgi:hypothetical protein
MKRATSFSSNVFASHPVNGATFVVVNILRLRLDMNLFLCPYVVLSFPSADITGATRIPGLTFANLMPIGSIGKAFYFQAFSNPDLCNAVRFFTQVLAAFTVTDPFFRIE